MHIQNAHIKNVNIKSTLSIVGTPIIDISYLTNWGDATFYGSPAFTSNYRVFTGNESIVTTSIDNSILANDSYTQEIWLRTSDNNNGCVLAKIADNGGYHVSAIEINNGNLVAGYWGGTSTLYYNFGPISRDVWQHYTITYDATSGIIKGYINGISVGDTVLAEEISPRDYGSNPQWYQLFASETTNFGSGYSLICNFGEFRAYSRALSYLEVEQNFKATRSRW